MNMIDSVLRGFTCIIYMIAQIHITNRCSEGEDWVFDGAHKLESVFEFMNDGFELAAGPTTGQQIKEHEGKKFSQLPPAIKLIIKQYAFVVNWIDPEIASDPDQLRILWERLNRAGVALNDFELSIPVIAPLIDSVLVPAMNMFKNTVFYPKDVSERGKLETSIQGLLAIIDLPDFKGSQNKLVKAWQDKELGSTMRQRADSVAVKATLWLDHLTRCHKIMQDLKDLAVFCDPTTGVEDIAEGIRRTELPFVLGCLARRFERIEDFRTQKIAIAESLRREIFSKKAEDILALLGGGGRNATFQRKLKLHIEQLIGYKEVAPRRFSKKIQRAALVKQGGICPSCSMPILKEQLFDGDHVLPWSEGGETTADNLQVLHRHCHQEKTATTVSLTA